MIFHDPDISKLARQARRAVCLGGLTVLTGCGQLDEPGMREELSRYFALGETLSFESNRGCIAGVFKLDDSFVGSALPVVNGIGPAIMTVERRGLVALDDTRMSPDQALVQIANARRDLGMRMRGALLGSRACMDEVAESAIGQTLVNPYAVLAFDEALRALMLVDKENRLLVVTVGAVP